MEEQESDGQDDTKGGNDGEDKFDNQFLRSLALVMAGRTIVSWRW